MTPDGKILQARMKLRKEVPYVGDLLIYLQPTAGDHLPTMGVNAKGRLTYNEGWVETLTPEQVKAVLIHEVLHLALLHPFREPAEVIEARDNGGAVTADVINKHHVFNIACDLKINFMFHEMGNFAHLPPEGCLPTKHGSWNTQGKGGFKQGCISAIDKKSAEQIYRELLALQETPIAEEIQLTSSHADWFGEDGEDGNGGEGNGAKDGGEGNGQTRQQVAGDWMVRAANALTQHKGKGTMPSSLVRAMEDMLTPKIDWKGKLQRFVQPIVACGSSYRRPRRTSWVTGIIMPGQDRSGVHIIAHVDTSGSMRKEELEQIAGELYGILDAHPHVSITLLHSDAGEPQVIELRETDKDDILDMVNLEGGGGTSHIPVVDWVLENNHEGLEALVCFTDGLSDIQNPTCFDKLAGVVVRMLIITREEQIDRLAPHCEDIAHLPCT